MKLIKRMFCKHSGYWQRLDGYLWKCTNCGAVSSQIGVSAPAYYIRIRYPAPSRTGE